MQSHFRLKQLQIQVKLECCHLNDIDLGITNYLTKFLLKHSKKLDGVPICYEILSTARTGSIIYGDPCVILVCIIEMVVLNFQKGDLIEVKDGFAMGALQCPVDGNLEFSGQVRFDAWIAEGDKVSLLCARV